jgi:glyoxylase-like metal-dependent hydrolase (beta-lactamase superfamily II)
MMKERSDGPRALSCQPPAPGEHVEVSAGVLWTRLSLPFRLDHVNIYIIDDGRAWHIVDTGIASQGARETWEHLLAGLLAGRPVEKIIVTHHHPDHVGLASWLAEKVGAEVVMSGTEYLLGLTYWLDSDAMKAHHYREFYRRRGLNTTAAESILDRGARYQALTSPLPFAFHRVIDGDDLSLATRRFQVITGPGHSPEQVMLYSTGEGIFVGADQVMLSITPNISVSARNPNSDVLGHFMSSLSSLSERIDSRSTVLPGHHVPFTGLQERVQEILDHHEARLRDIVTACSSQPRSTADLLSVLFRFSIEGPAMELAFGEACAHVNRLLATGRITSVLGPDGVERYIGSYPV